MFYKVFLGLVMGFSLGLSLGASADQTVTAPAAKIDSGLGELPHYSQWKGAPWLYSVPAEKVDSGLGALPPHAEWRERGHEGRPVTEETAKPAVSADQVRRQAAAGSGR